MLDAVTNLRSLRSLLASEPSFDSAITGRDAVLVVNEAARALTVAGLAEASERRPILVATATHNEAVRLANDAAAVLGTDEVALFSAWGTLPFERVSPAIETMGQRLRLLSRLGDPVTTPSVIVASARALVQRLDPEAATDPIICGTGDVIDSVVLAQQLVEFGYRREPQVEHRGEFAVRGSIVDVFLSTADRPVRIDLWGDEVERVTEFSVADQRATIPVSEVEIYPCRELRPNGEAQQRAQQLLADEPWGREQWDRVVDGELFDGMESWLPWLVSDEVVLPDLLSADSWVILVEPRRIRDRAADIEAEEADLAVSLAKTWDVDADDLHRLHVPFDRLLARTNVPILTMLPVADRPGIATVASSAWAPVVGDIDPAVSRVRQLLSDRYCVVVTADGPASAERLAALLSEHGVEVDPAGVYTDLSTPGAHLVAVPLERGAVLHEIKLRCCLRPT